ncbi:hypothetical protein DXA11_28125 [Bacteroides sp. AM56-10ce]|nr:hypothetical protein DXA11_28125 [Bacteroides sp. AM56-10ce]
MNTFWKITLGFMIGVVCTLATLIVMGTGYNDNAEHKPTEYKNRVLQFKVTRKPQGIIFTHLNFPQKME